MCSATFKVEVEYFYRSSHIQVDLDVGPKLGRADDGFTETTAKMGQSPFRFKLEVESGVRMEEATLLSCGGDGHKQFVWKKGHR
jgi:hypothetical protein